MIGNVWRKWDLQSPSQHPSKPPFLPEKKQKTIQ